MTTASAPVVGLLWEMGNVSDALDGFALGLSYRGQSAIDVDTLIDTDITVWADLSEESDPIAAPVQASGIALVLSEFVTPRQASAGFSGQIGERFTGSVDVTYVGPDGQVAVLVDGYRYLAAPTLTSVVPGLGNVTGLTEVTLIGTGRSKVRSGS